MNTKARSPIGLVVTGGTIGSEVVGEEVRLRRGDGPPPELDFLSPDEGSGFEVVRPLQKLSENIVPADWVTIADAIVALAESCALSGMVVLHGTDTAPYTAAALSFLTSDLEVPVVLTGSNIPATAPDSDAPTNVRDAIIAAGHLDRGTHLSFSGTPGEPSLVFSGTDVRKVAATGQAFASVKGWPVASVADERFVRGTGLAAPPKPGGYPRRVDDRVLGVTLYPGIDLRALAEAAIRGGMRGIVVELYATGTGPTVDGGSSLPDFIRRCNDHGVVVVTTASKLPAGRASVYETFADIRDAGAIFDGRLIFEAAVAKLMWASAQSRSVEQVKRLMLGPPGEGLEEGGGA
ncbi:MAG: asparaginase [Rubrobacteraceae bacterium]